MGRVIYPIIDPFLLTFFALLLCFLEFLFPSLRHFGRIYFSPSGSIERILELDLSLAADEGSLPLIFLTPLFRIDLGDWAEGLPIRFPTELIHLSLLVESCSILDPRGFIFFSLQLGHSGGCPELSLLPPVILVSACRATAG